MAFLYGRAGRLTAKNGVFRPGQYYTLNQSATPRGSTACVDDANGVQDQCGMDMLDGWPWQTKWTGKVRADSEMLVLLVLTCCSCCCSSACCRRLTRLLLGAGRLGGQLDPAPAHPLHVVAAGDAASEKDAKLAQKLGQLQPFIAVFPHACMGQLASVGPT